MARLGQRLVDTATVTTVARRFGQEQESQHSFGSVQSLELLPVVAFARTQPILVEALFHLLLSYSGLDDGFETRDLDDRLLFE